MASSSNPIPMVVNYGKSLVIKPKTLSLGEEDLKLIVYQIVDFESFRVNRSLLQTYFEDQEWLYYFEMLNGPTFSYLVKDFRVRAKVYDESLTAFEECQKITQNEELEGKKREGMSVRR